LRKFILPLVVLVAVLVSSCGNKSGDTNQTSTDKKEFGWKDNVTDSDIPDFPVKGMISGKEIQFGYINLEKWRGSNDNVLNFSVSKPEQSCGFIENFEGFVLMKKGSEMKQGDWSKAKFDSDAGSYAASFRSAGNTSSAGWNCALELESIDNKKAAGKILICFNDPAKSWIAGKFEANICNN
jgi:hypothetical protein